MRALSISIVADAYTRVGNNKQTLDILHKIADLDPNNTEIRLKLADGYLKEDMRREAVGAFVQAANRLQQTAAHDRALDAYSKALSLIPDQRDALRGMLETHIVRGTPDDAAEVLEPVVKDNEKDHELVSMLARAYLAAEDPKGAERATSLLMAMDQANYPQFLPVAQLYLKVGEIDETVRILGTIIERMLQGREERDLLKLVNGVLEQNPDHVGGLRMLVRIHWWQRDMDSLRNTLERLAEAAEAAELVDDERYALTQLVRLAPDEQRYLDRLNLLGGLQEETTEGLLISSETADVPQFETFDTHESKSNGDFAEVIEFETNAAPGATVDPTSSFADLNEMTDASGVGSRSAESFQEVDLGFNDTVESAPGVPADAESEALRVENLMRQELESVDFYITQGYSDIAIDTLDVLEKQFGPQPEIQKRREQLASATASAVPEVFEFGGADDLPAAHEETVPIEADMAFASLAIDDGSVKPSGGKGIDSGLAELFEEFRVAEEEDSGHEDFETHYNMGTAYKEMELMDEAIQEFQTSVALVKSDDGTPRFLQCCNMLGHCFVHKGMPEAAIMWFKKGLAAPGHSEDEYQALRYELGGAYEEMGDVDQALQCYTEVYGVDVNYREVGEKLRSLKQKL